MKILDTNSLIAMGVFFGFIAGVVLTMVVFLGIHQEAIETFEAPKELTDQNTLMGFCKAVEESKLNETTGTWVNSDAKILNYFSAQLLLMEYQQEELLKWKKGSCYDNPIVVEFAFKNLVACDNALDSCRISCEQEKTP